MKNHLHHPYFLASQNHLHMHNCNVNKIDTYRDHWSIKNLQFNDKIIHILTIHYDNTTQQITPTAINIRR